MIRLTGYLVAFLVVVSASLAVGCKKKSSASPGQTAGTPTAPKLDGADDVLGAVDKRDYNGAMAALIKIHERVSTDEQKVEYMVLTRKLKEKLLEASATDPKANDALAALRGMSLGR